MNSKSLERGLDKHHEFMKKKLKKDRSISSFFEEHVKETSEVQSRVREKKTVTRPAPYETEPDSDPDSLSDETSPEGVSLGLYLLLPS